jgi:hypothetical protein
MKEKHWLEKIDLQQKIDTLTTILTTEPSNVHNCRYYFMSVKLLLACDPGFFY